MTEPAGRAPRGRVPWPRILTGVGVAAMLIGAADPLEGAFVILPGSGMVALGAALGKSDRRRLLGWAFALVTFGVLSMVGLSLLGGIGGDTGRSMAWGLLAAPYPIGWILGLVGIFVPRLTHQVRRWRKARMGVGGTDR